MTAEGKLRSQLGETFGSQLFDERALDTEYRVRDCLIRHHVRWIMLWREILVGIFCRVMTKREGGTLKFSLWTKPCHHAEIAEIV